MSPEFDSNRFCMIPTSIIRLTQVGLQCVFQTDAPKRIHADQGIFDQDTRSLVPISGFGTFHCRSQTSGDRVTMGRAVLHEWDAKVCRKYSSDSFFCRLRLFMLGYGVGIYPDVETLLAEIVGSEVND